jgi:hypothetical protein
MLSQKHAAFDIIKNDEMNGLPIVDDLVLPSSSDYGAWSLTLQLLTADLIKDPQAVTAQLTKVVSHVSLLNSRLDPLSMSPTQQQQLTPHLSNLQTVSTHGLLLLGLTSVDPSRSVLRGLKRATFTKRTSSQLLIGSVDEDFEESGEDFDFEVETANGVDNSSDTTSLFMRAIIASTLANSDSIAALVHLAKSGELKFWSQELKTAGFSVDEIEVISLAPHAPNSVEARLQAQLLILHEEMSEIDSFDEKKSAAALKALESSFSSTTLSAFSSNFTGEMVCLGLAAALVACLAAVAIVQAKRSAETKATASDGFIKNTRNLSDSSADLGAYSKISSESSHC